MVIPRRARLRSKQVNRIIVDVVVFSVGIAVSTLLAVLLAKTLLGTGAEGLGPTAASLNDAYATLVAGGLGILTGTAMTVILWQGRWRILTGITVGCITYIGIFWPLLVIDRPSGISHHDAMQNALVGFVLLIPFILIGPVLGWLSRIAFRIGSAARH